MKLVIAEKPSLARKIASALGAKNTREGYIEGKDYIITWALGHLFSLKDVEDYEGLAGIKWEDISLPFIPDFEFKFAKDNPEFQGGIEKQFNIIKNLVNDERIASIIHCGDSEREGQLIIDEILNFLSNKKPVFRLWIPDQTEETILREIKSMKPNEEYKNLYNEALTRCYMDWVIGINLTVYMSLKAHKTINVGRVIIPIIKFIYDRDIAIRNFKSEKYFQLESKTEKDNIPINLLLRKEKFTTKEAANDFLKSLKDKKAIVTSIVKKEIKTFPKKLFKLSTIQAEMSNKFKMPYKKTEDIIQKLYEENLLTYPRTGSEYLSESEKEQFKKVIEVIIAKGYDLEFKDSKRIFDSSKVESHSALTPTTKLPENLSKDEELVYTSIFNRFIANFLKEEAIISETTITIKVDEHIFKLKGKQIIKEGFYKYEPEKFNNQLPDLKENEEFETNFIIVEKQTEPPKKVSESELSRFLEAPFRKELKEETDENEETDLIIDDTEEYKMLLKGIEIGTPATRTQIIENAKAYNYISQSNSVYSITSFGEKVVQLLEELEVNLFKEQNIEFSKTLKKVYHNSLSIDEALAETFSTLETIIQKNLPCTINFNDSLGKCPKCNGDILIGTSNYYCSNNKTGCSFKLWKNSKHYKETFSISPEQAEKLLKNETVPCELILENKKRKANLKIKLTDEYVNFEEIKEIIGKCPKCDGDVIENDLYFSCINSKTGCSFKLWKAAKHYGNTLKITKSIAKKLLKKNGSFKFEVEKNGKKIDMNLKIKLNGEYVNFEEVK